MTHVTFKWNICANINVIELYLGLELRCSKLLCFLFEWDNRGKSHHYVKRIWPTTKILEPVDKNIEHHSLVESSRILLSTLHIKLGLI
jgi:hypothetical protein